MKPKINCKLTYNQQVVQYMNVITTTPKLDIIA